MITKKVQEVLQDISPTGRVRPWREKKMKNQLLSYAYQDIDPAKAERLQDCASWLEYQLQENGLKKLVNANFCRVRLCPTCIWRRGLKIYSQTMRIMQAMEQEREYGYIFITLTVRNCSGDELSATLDSMMAAWNRFIKYKRIDDVVHGWYRGMEVTHNLDRKSDFFDTYHPHFHCVFAVNKNYFNNKEYIKHADWQALWKKAMQIDYDPQVDVRRVKGNTAAAVSEVAKYAVKDADYIISDDWDLTVDTVRLLDAALHKRRFVAYGKKFKELHKALHLDDTEDGDLIHLDGEEETEESGERVFYSWNVGYNQYIKI